MSWSRAFDDPIPFPDGGELRTLRDAGHYVTALSKADQGKPHWQTAAHELTMAAERGGILMLAEIAMRQALTHGQPKPTRHRGRRRSRSTGSSDDHFPLACALRLRNLSRHGVNPRTGKRVPHKT
jgi:hypothetical protein